MDRCSRWGEQECDREEIFLGSHHSLLIMKHTPPPLDLPSSAVLSIRKTEKLSDGVTAVSGTEGMSHVSDKQIMLQSLMSHWKLILALRSSILFSKDWTLASRMLGRGGLWALFLSLLRIPVRFPRRFLILRLWSLFSSACRRISSGQDEFMDKVTWNSAMVPERWWTMPGQGEARGNSGGGPQRSWRANRSSDLGIGAKD